MYTIVGLGNPGIQYAHTRHNIGWLVLEALVEKRSFPVLSKSAKYVGLLSEFSLDGVDASILFPTTFMNNSGTSVAKYMAENQSELIVVHDDVDLAFGEIKVSYDRGAGGHNGVRSIIACVGNTAFIRIRIGVAKKGFFGGVSRPAGDKLAEYVLGELSKSEIKQVPDIANDVNDIIGHIFAHGVAYAMQEGNRKF